MAELFSPSCPIPFILQPEVRIQQLKKALETEIGQIQRVNIEALIRMYESGEIGPRQIGDPPIYLAGGKRVDHDPWKDPSLTPGPVKWRECGGDPNLTRPFLVSNDTGSTLLTVFLSDLVALNFDSTLHNDALEGYHAIATASGQTFEPLMTVEMQIVSPTFEGLTPWFEEIAVIKEDTPGITRLSGANMRRYLYFATRPGNRRLYVSQKKAGLMRILPC
ncbi:hypothetical protein N7450_004830 [Penicillium hetheringtonii]|uniref:Uncharacterized protein n=1 Tax=Penicillium hetheringtonii TaxID=911720 RepID=A0AAD6DQR5_9EURO|nr:hypothetical protein N7450_004830 [Penicillium hetheringtonii]